MKTVRLGSELEERLKRAADRLGVSESDVIRSALEGYLGEVERDPVEDLMALFEQWEREDKEQGLDKLPPTNFASHSSQLYGDQLYEEWRAKNRKPLKIAESRSEYHPAPSTD